MNLNNLSLKEIKYKLQTKGINSDDIDDYVSNNSETLNEYEINSAKNIIIKKNTMEEQQLIQFLLKKGYKIDSIKEAISLAKE